ncbi:MAG: chemotaxis protein CheB [Vicinamibacterales bacterium]
MPASRVVVIGASAGGIEAITAVLGALSSDFPAAVFVVLHTGARSADPLSLLLGRAGTLPAAVAVDGETFEAGRVYVAAPDRHMVLDNGRVRVRFGPKHHGFRPAVDPLFVSAARACGTSAAGVILSGALSDGAAGLAAIKVAGGVALVQDPAEALVEWMPLSAIKMVEVDGILRASEIGTRLVQWANGAAAMTSVKRRERIPSQGARAISSALSAELSQLGALSALSCPECGGALWELDEQGVAQYVCHLGHRFGEESLSAILDERAEAAMWSAVRVLRERSSLRRKMALDAETRGMRTAAGIWRNDAEEADSQAQAIVQAMTGSGRSRSDEVRSRRSVRRRHDRRA